MIGKRLSIAIPMLWVIATITFFVVNALPVDVAQNILGDLATQTQVAALRHELGLDRSLWEQYWSWLIGAVHGDFGTSYMDGSSVTQDVLQRLPVTMSLALCATLTSAFLGIVIGTLAAVYGGWIDRVARAVTSAGMAIPGFWAAGLLVLVFAVWLGVLPATGYTNLLESPTQWARGLVLPVAAVALASVASIARQSRASLIQVLGMDYIRSLRAAGIPNSSIIVRHGLRNAAIPVVTILGLEFVSLFSGTIIVEQVFALPGISQLALSAVFQGDTPVILGVVIYATVIVLLLNLAVDICYVWLNPRERQR